MRYSDPHRISCSASCSPWWSLIVPQKPFCKCYPDCSPQRGRSPVINRSTHKDAQGLGFIGLRKPSPGGCGENSQLSFPLARGTSREWKKADGKLQNAPDESHMLGRCAALPDLNLIGTTCGIHGLRGDARLHLVPRK